MAHHLFYEYGLDAALGLFGGVAGLCCGGLVGLVIDGSTFQDIDIMPATRAMAILSSFIGSIAGGPVGVGTWTIMCIFFTINKYQKKPPPPPIPPEYWSIDLNN